MDSLFSQNDSIKIRIDIPADLSSAGFFHCLEAAVFQQSCISQQFLAYCVAETIFVSLISANRQTGGNGEKRT